MDGKNYLARIDYLTKNNRLISLCLLTMFVWNIYNWSLASSMQSKTQVVVVPIGAEGMQIGNGRASELYLRRMARYITSMLGNYTAASARMQLLELLDLFPPDKTAAVQTSFEKIASDIERFPSISSNIRWIGEEPLRYNREVMQVSVRKTRLVNGVPTDTNDVIYCLSYEIRETKFYLLNVKERERVGENTCLREEDNDSQDAS